MCILRGCILPTEFISFDYFLLYPLISTADTGLYKLIIVMCLGKQRQYLYIQVICVIKPIGLIDFQLICSESVARFTVFLTSGFVCPKVPAFFTFFFN